MKIWKIMRRAIALAVALLGLSLAFASASYASDIDGNWNLVKIAGEPLMPDTSITARFATDGGGTKINGNACNVYFASVLFNSDGSIKIPRVSSTKMGCGEEGEQELKYILALRATKSYQLSGDKLTLDGGGTTLEYVKAAS